MILYVRQCVAKLSPVVWCLHTHTHAGGSKKGEGNQELDTGSMLDHTHTHTDHSGHCDGNLLVPIRQFGEDECEMYHQSMCFGKTQTLYETLRQ